MGRHPLAFQFQNRWRVVSDNNITPLFGNQMFSALHWHEIKSSFRILQMFETHSATILVSPSGLDASIDDVDVIGNSRLRQDWRKWYCIIFIVGGYAVGDHGHSDIVCLERERPTGPRTYEIHHEVCNSMFNVGKNQCNRSLGDRGHSRPCSV